MLILPDWGVPLNIENLTDPLPVKYNWMFNSDLLDFVLFPIQYLEETTGPALKLRINNTEFWVPESWSILVADIETFQIDTVTIRSCATSCHQAFSFCTDETTLRTFDIEVIDYSPQREIVHPLIPKGMSLAHPTGSIYRSGGQKVFTASVIIGPHDLHKYLADKYTGDIFTY